MAEEKLTYFHGNALDLHIEATGTVVSMRRFGSTINFGLIGTKITVLTADQAELIGKSLLGAAELAREATDG